MSVQYFGLIVFQIRLVILKPSVVTVARGRERKLTPTVTLWTTL